MRTLLMTSVALAAMTAAAQRPDAFAAAAERVAAERDDLAARLRDIEGVRTWPASANYVLIEVADGPRALRALRDAGIAVRPAASFPGLGPDHLRITARAPGENARLAQVLRRAMEGRAVGARGAVEGRAGPDGGVGEAIA
jgi:histidinol-phosphate aminotransferase